MSESKCVHCTIIFHILILFCVFFAFALSFCSFSPAQEYKVQSKKYVHCIILHRDSPCGSCTRPTTTSSPTSWPGSTTASSSTSWMVAAGKSTKSSFDRPVSSILLGSDVDKHNECSATRPSRHSGSQHVPQHVFLSGKIRAKLLKPENSEMKTVSLDDMLDRFFVHCISLRTHSRKRTSYIHPRSM